MNRMWLEHNGGQLNFPDGVLLDVQRKDGSIEMAVQSQDVVWRHEGCASDVARFRLSSEEKSYRLGLSTGAVEEVSICPPGTALKASLENDL